MIWLFCSVALLAAVAPPTFRYLPDSRVVLESSTPDAVIRYTFEDRDPDKSAGVYFGPVDVPVGRVLRARVFSASHEDISSVLLIAGRPQPSTVVEVTQNRDWKNYDWATRHRATAATARGRRRVSSPTCAPGTSGSRSGSPSTPRAGS